MPQDAAPVLLAYDGSGLAQTAVRRTAEFFPDFRVVVATVWEPALRELPVVDPTGGGGLWSPADPGTLEQIERDQHEHAEIVAREGAELARSLGLAAEPHAVPDEVDVADTLIDLAREQGAALVVVGSHGISGMRSRLLGRVSRKLIDHCDRPVLVIRRRH